MLPLVSKNESEKRIRASYCLKNSKAIQLADQAVASLLEEVRLTPKPGLVDALNTGIHSDMNIALFEKSAYSLWSTFYQIAMAGMESVSINQDLREHIAYLGRNGEGNMYEATGGVNTHKGAIWALGLITAVAAHLLAHSENNIDGRSILTKVGILARFPDQKYTKPVYATHGDVVKEKYKVKNALELAQDGFPIIANVALNDYDRFSQNTKYREVTLQNVLVGIIGQLDDTCILYRSDLSTLRKIQYLAKEILQNGGVQTIRGRSLYQYLDRLMMQCKVSPGGSADMLAATIFIQKIVNKKL